MLEQVLTLKELSSYLSISESSAYKLLQNGEIRAFKTNGGHWRVPESSIKTYIYNKCEIQSRIINPVIMAKIIKKE